MSFLGEIKRRKVFQVAAVYAVVAWLIVQVITSIEAPLNLPDWVDTLVIVLLAIGFPITLIISWAFNLTAEGIVKDEGKHAAEQGGGKRIEYVLIGFVIVAVGWLTYRVEFDESETVAESSVATDPSANEITAATLSDLLPNSIAILPFENLSPDPDNAYFAAGIHESTLNQLAKISGMVVIARTSVMQYKENPPPIPEIAKALNVETVMEGSVRYANEQVLITAQLIDGRTGAHLWSDEFNRELVDVFAVQAEVAKQIATAMQVQLLPEEQARIETRPTESTEAYEHYLYALSLPYWYLFPEYWPLYSDSLEQAIAADPKYADAYTALSYGYYMRRDLAQAAEYAEKAIALDPTIGRAHWILGMTVANYYSKRVKARDSFRRAIEYSGIDPRSLLEPARMLAEDSGEYDEAIHLANRALAMDQTDSQLLNLYGLLMIRARQLPEAAASLREAIKIDPGNYLHYLNLATVAYLEGDHDSARAELSRAVKIASSRASFRVGYVAYLYGLVGEPEQAEALLAQQLALRNSADRENWRPLGWAVLGTRDKQRALTEWTTTVEGYINEDQPVSIGRITRFRDNWLNDPMLEELEFIALRKRLGFKG